MDSTRKRTIAAFVAVPALALGGVGLAGAAKDSGKSGSGGPPGMRRGGNMPGALTGETAAKAKAAAVAAVPGTALFARKIRSSGAAYEVLVKAKAGGVYRLTENASFAVISKRKDTRGAGGGGMGVSGAPPSSPPGAASGAAGGP